jgi:hypothetical protein
MEKVVGPLDIIQVQSKGVTNLNKWVVILWFSKSQFAHQMSKYLVQVVIVVVVFLNKGKGPSVVGQLLSFDPIINPVIS